jgi:hypothetical protein
MCAASYKKEPNHYPPRPQTASSETSLATSMRVLNLGPSVPSGIRPASGKRRIARGPSEGEGVISYNFAGGLRTSSQVCPLTIRDPHRTPCGRDRFTLLTHTDGCKAGCEGWYRQFEDVRPRYGSSSVSSRPQTARPATVSKAETIAKVANGEYQRNKLRNSTNNIFG